MDPKDKNLRQDLQDLTDKIEITQKLHSEHEHAQARRAGLRISISVLKS
jgi:hypothetical protein